MLDPDRPTRRVLQGEVVIQIPIRAVASTPPGLAVIVLSVHHQGCFEGSCLPPERRDLRVMVPIRAEDLYEQTCSSDDELD